MNLIFFYISIRTAYIFIRSFDSGILILSLYLPVSLFFSHNNLSDLLMYSATDLMCRLEIQFKIK